MQDEFIEFVRHETGQEFNDFRDWKLGMCLDLIEKFVESKLQY